MNNREIADKTKELGYFFNGMSTLDTVLVLANFTATLIYLSVKDKSNYDKAVDEFAFYVRKGVDVAKEGGGE